MKMRTLERLWERGETIGICDDRDRQRLQRQSTSLMVPCVCYYALTNPGNRHGRDEGTTWFPRGWECPPP